MKRRIKNTSEDLLQVKNDSVVGIFWHDSNNTLEKPKSIIIKKNHDEFVSIGPDSWIKTGLTLCWDRESAEEYVINVFNIDDKNRVYIFDTIEEAWKWVFNDND